MLKNKNPKTILDTNVKTLSVTFYDEQLSIEPRKLVERIINTPIDKAEVVMIIHTKEGKDHYHLGIRLVGKNKKNGKHIITLLNYYGIRFRTPEDDNLILKAVDTIRDFQRYLTYLLHKTEKAKSENKEQYEVEDIITNISGERIKMYLDGYVDKKAETKRILEELDKLAYDYGYALRDFDDLLVPYDIDIRGHSKIRVIKESYQRGIHDRIKEDDRVIRLCIFIKGPKDIGKTYGATEALKKMGYNNIVKPSGGKTGMFDDVKATTEAIIIDDDKLENALNICDNMICKVYRRNSNNPVFAGDVVIITSNYSFDEWADRCGYSNKVIEPLRSRLYISHVDSSRKLFCDSPSKRGTEDEQLVRKKKYKEFKGFFEKEISEYQNQRKIDYSDIND